MDSIVHWFLQNIISPLLLPVFVLALLCMLAGARPEPIIAAFVSACGAAVSAVIGLLAAIVRAVTPRSSRPWPPRR